MPAVRATGTCRSELVTTDCWSESNGPLLLSLSEILLVSDVTSCKAKIESKSITLETLE